MITDLQKQARQLSAQIAAAFDAVPYPGDDNLYEGGQRDDDYEDVIRNLSGKHWRDLVPKQKPPRGRSNPLAKDLAFCSTAAWHFFLPAYFIADIMRGEISTFPFELRNCTAPRFSRLNAEQCAAVISFFAYANMLLDEKQKNKPQYAAYYEWERQKLVPVLAYWNSRIDHL